jgi:hypothetical protein
MACAWPVCATMRREVNRLLTPSANSSPGLSGNTSNNEFPTTSLRLIKVARALASAENSLADYEFAFSRARRAGGWLTTRPVRLGQRDIHNKRPPWRKWAKLVERRSPDHVIRSTNASLIGWIYEGLSRYRAPARWSCHKQVRFRGQRR